MRKLILIFVFFCLVSMIGCNNTINIGLINNNPEKFLNKECIVSGWVTEIIDIPGLKNDVFKLDDRTGVIWVYTTTGALPEKNTKVKVIGKFKKLLKIPFVNFEAEYYIELLDMY